ncbi:MAG: hypothetical protein A2946_02885 [Candidatus Liptonbacteria bacterium RIFCSPLOWO2_01_FULL_53_13]|uniref:CMP/dCMP-type deaminase domain-containing protein n=1 Tax=Candidatus Liptonbacteria bacterium RIFCSPLOWO2_01_FULL_53_13 TaxID=1798651 RepID=A0A1G2CL20_9BACT|nr:MAG: hypothetical protein A2946_02885 [Candidatus Liptonbacteria bacterium RIFCSPLOWO2_01_FULL_53_13]
MGNVNYPYLPEGRSFGYVPSSHPMMREARRVCEEQSTDKNHPTGSVLVRDGRVLAEGANQASFKNPALLEFHRTKFCLRRFLHIKTGTRYWLCPGCASPAQHSEQVVIRNARVKNSDSREADIYLWGHWWCCKPCWDAIIAAGVRNVYLAEGAERSFRN